MSRRGLLIALLVSLAVNLFVLGGLSGAALMGLWRPHDGPPPGPARLAAVGESLAAPQRQAWDAVVRQTIETSGPKLRQARALRRQGWQALTSEPADPQAALAALNQSRALELQARGAMDQAVVNFAATLPADQRRALAQALSRAHPHPPGGRWSGGGAGREGPGREGPDRNGPDAPLPHG